VRDIHAAADHTDLSVFSFLFWIPGLSIANWSCHLVVKPQKQPELRLEASAR
jgi:hypothetical protein